MTRALKRFIPLLTAAIVVFLGGCKKDKDPIQERNVRAELQTVVDSVYRVFDEQWGIDNAGVMTYITGPKGSYMVSSNIDPVPSENEHFRIASITKTFTAAAIMLLHQEGELNIGDLVDEHLPNTPEYNIPNKSEITIAQLLGHRAGVFDVTNQPMPQGLPAPYAGMKYEDYVRNQDNEHTFTLSELVGLVAEHQLQTAEAGEAFNYSNTGYNVLGLIIEEVSGLSYSDFITQRFIVPLGLTNTYSVWEGDDLEMNAPFVNSYLYVEGEPEINTSADNMSVHVTEGNIVSTPKDITNWMRLLLNGNAGISAANVALMKEMLPADEAHGVYGLGLVYDDGLGFGHDGAHLSYVSSLRYNPENGVTVLVTANFIRIDPQEPEMESFYTLAFGVRDACSAVSAEYLK